MHFLQVASDSRANVGILDAVDGADEVGVDDHVLGLHLDVVHFERFPLRGHFGRLAAREHAEGQGAADSEQSMGGASQ